MATVPKHSRELQCAVQDDIRRQEIDAAKKRAAAQNVDYETFSALVSMAHLKPFQHTKGKQPPPQLKSSLPAWSFDASGILKTTSNHNTNPIVDCSKTIALMQSEHSRTDSATIDPIPITYDTFKKDWKKKGSNTEEKMKFLLKIPHNDLLRIFKVELPPSILTEIVNALRWWRNSSDEAQKPAYVERDIEEMPCHMTDNTNGQSRCLFDPYLAFQILSSLCDCGRFSLSVKLVGASVKSSVVDLIDHIIQLKTNEASLDSSKCKQIGECVNPCPKGLELLSVQKICLDKLRELSLKYKQ